MNQINTGGSYNSFRLAFNVNFPMTLFMRDSNSKLSCFILSGDMAQIIKSGNVTVTKLSEQDVIATYDFKATLYFHGLIIYNKDYEYTVEFYNK